MEGNGIHFGTFKDSRGDLVTFKDGSFGSQISGGSKLFNMCHFSYKNFGGWAGCDLRYDVLGSTDIAPSGYGAAPTSGNVGYDATENCAINPVPGTLMAALPAQLRAVMKPMTKYTNNVGGYSNSESMVTASIDYLPLYSEFEAIGNRSGANSYEQNKQKQYAYFAQASRVSIRDTWTRSATSSEAAFCRISGTGSSTASANYSYAIAPIFKV